MRLLATIDQRWRNVADKFFIIIPLVVFNVVDWKWIGFKVCEIVFKMRPTRAG